MQSPRSTVSSPSTLPMPSPTIVERSVDEDIEAYAKSLGYSSDIARVIAGRIGPYDGQLEKLLLPTLSDIDVTSPMSGLDEASARLCLAIERGETVVAVCDHDSDGITSAAEFLRGMEMLGHPREMSHVRISHRLQEGYGLTQGVCDRILAMSPKPTLVVTADCGSSDEDRILRLRNSGIETIVTDHHDWPCERPPVSAHAAVNPKQPGCPYPDKTVAGCFVMWLLLVRTRGALMRRTGHTFPSLTGLLQFTAVGTVADCVTLATSTSNRAVFRHGVELIRSRGSACWSAFSSVCGLGEDVIAETIAFKIAPMINANGRLDDAMTGLHALMAEDYTSAIEHVSRLHEENILRREIEKGMLDVAKPAALDSIRRGNPAIVVYLPDGHSGVHGIVAGKLKEMFGRPTAMASPVANDPNLTTASFRSIAGLHIRDVLEEISAKHPGLLLKYGGHAAAAGATWARESNALVEKLFNAAVARRVNPAQLGPKLLTDGPLSSNMLSLASVDEIRSLEPWAVDFQTPRFEMQGRVSSMSAVGNPKVHLRLEVIFGGKRYPGIWFFGLSAPGANPPVGVGQMGRFVVSVTDNVFRGNRLFQLQIHYGNAI